MDEAKGNDRHDYVALLTGRNLGWAVAGGVAFIVGATTILAIDDGFERSFGSPVVDWLGDLVFMLLLFWLPVAIVWGVLLVQASLVHFVLTRWLGPSLAAFIAVSATYGLAIGIVAVIGLPWQLTVPAAIAGLGVATAAARSTAKPIT